MMPFKNIDELIPQKHPFVMIDELTYSDEKVTRTNFRVKGDNVFVENDTFRESGLLENIAQTAASRIGYLAKQENTSVPIGFIGAMKNVKIFALPKVNELIETEISIINQVLHVTIITGSVSCNNKTLATCEMKIVIPNQLNQ